VSSEIKPYLKEVNDLYKKICEFESRVSLKYSYNPVEGAHHYIKEDIDAVMDALSEGLDFTAVELEGLNEAMHADRIDFMRIRSDNKEEIPEDEFQLLYIMSRPFFKSLKNVMNMDNMFWQDGKCPVCSAVPALSLLAKESQRKYFCSFCGTEGYYMRIGCPGCLSENPGDITIITLEGEEGMRADTCENCKTYYKTFEGPMADDHSPDSLDIMSIPLDIVVQEKGFHRCSPNPVGIRKMS